MQGTKETKKMKGKFLWMQLQLPTAKTDFQQGTNDWQNDSAACGST